MLLVWQCRLLHQLLPLWVSHSTPAPQPRQATPNCRRGCPIAGGLSRVSAPPCPGRESAMIMPMLAQFLSLSGMLAVQQRWPSAAREHLHAAEGARCLRLSMQFLRCEV